MMDIRLETGFGNQPTFNADISQVERIDRRRICTQCLVSQIAFNQAIGAGNSMQGYLVYVSSASAFNQDIGSWTQRK